MAQLPTVAIIGRPNTGKSTLFNRLIGRRKAIVSPIPGTTRDHVAHRVELQEMDYLLIDTGGMGGGTEDKELEEDVHRQSVLALEHADVIVLTVNSQEELTGSDLTIVETLRKTKRRHVPVILAVTKCDDPVASEQMLPQYYQFGIANHVIAVSAIHNMGTDDLQSAITNELRALHFQKEQPDPATVQSVPRIAILGKPNVGKSSIVNALMSDAQREKSPLLVSDIPGTTRDSTDTLIKYHGDEFLFVDTAGIKRRKATIGPIETYAYFRSVQALQYADICVLTLDASEPISRMDKRIAGMTIEEGKGLIILLNKGDLLTPEKKKTLQKEMEFHFPFCRFAPVVMCSAKTRDGLLKVFDVIASVQRNRSRRIATKDLNNWLQEVTHNQPLGVVGRAKHITQADEVPPTFAIFVKDPKAVQVSQLRYLENRLRETFGFEGTPVRWITKATEDSRKRS